MSSYKPMFLDEERILRRLVSATMPKESPINLKSDGVYQTSAKVKKPVYAFDIVEIKTRVDKQKQSRKTDSIPFERKKNAGYVYKENQLHKYAYNPPYGILPQLATLNPDELLSLANQFSIMKFQYQERGDYLRAFLFGWRQRLIERVLSRTATIEKG
jgi:hypothetical protein